MYVYLQTEEAPGRTRGSVHWIEEGKTSPFKRAVIYQQPLNNPLLAIQQIHLGEIPSEGMQCAGVQPPTHTSFPPQPKKEFDLFTTWQGIWRQQKL